MIDWTILRGIHFISSLPGIHYRQHVADALTNLFWACKRRDLSNAFFVKSC